MVFTEAAADGLRLVGVREDFPLLLEILAAIEIWSSNGHQSVATISGLGKIQELFLIKILRNSSDLHLIYVLSDIFLNFRRLI